MPEPIVSLIEENLKPDLRELMRRTVEDTLNCPLEEEAGDPVGAERYERAAGRETYRAGLYERSMIISSGEITIRMPGLKGMWIVTAIIERYRRRTRVVGTLPDGESALILVTARLKYVTESEWDSKRHLDVTLLDEQPYRTAGLGGCRKARKNLDTPTETDKPLAAANEYAMHAGSGSRVSSRTRLSA